MTCNLVTLLTSSYLVTLKVSTICVPIHDVRTAIAVLSVALKTYQLWRRKALRHAFPGMSLKFKEHHPRNSDSHTLGGREQMRAFWALDLQTRQRHQQIYWCSFHSSLCVPMYQSERMRDGIKNGHQMLNLHHSRSLHFPSVLHCLANFALVELQCGSVSGSFILDFSLLSGPWPWESKFFTHVSKPLCKLLVENKQQKLLIDRAKPRLDDVHLTFQQFLFITILIYTEAF